MRARQLREEQAQLAIDRIQQGELPPWCANGSELALLGGELDENETNADGRSMSKVTQKEAKGGEAYGHGGGRR